MCGLGTELCSSHFFWGWGGEGRMCIRYSYLTWHGRMAMPSEVAARPMDTS